MRHLHSNYYDANGALGSIMVQLWSNTELTNNCQITVPDALLVIGELGEIYSEIYSANSGQLVIITIAL